MGGVGKRLCVVLVLVGEGDLKLHADEEAFGIVVDGRACADDRVGSGIGRAQQVAVSSTQDHMPPNI